MGVTGQMVVRVERFVWCAVGTQATSPRNGLYGHVTSSQVGSNGS
jgi:hypothetical protein